MSDIEHTLREALSEEGIDSLDALVSRLASLVSTELRDEDRVFMIAHAAWESRPQPPAPHQAPEMNLFVDGERHDPYKIAEFNGKALYSTPGVDAKGEPTLYSFTTPRSLNDHLIATPLHDVGTTNPDSLSPIASYFEHDDQGGDRLQSNPGRGWNDLTRVRRGPFGLNNWNDIISSVDWCRWDISLFEHVGYAGSQLYLRAGRTYNHLSNFGWNDRASSVGNWGTRS